MPVEILFDQGLGDLFVIRTAGNVLARPGIGSVEYAVLNLDTPLVVVLGHTQCGAVRATLDALQQPSEGTSPNLRAIVDFIRPSVQPLLNTACRSDLDAVVRQAVRANVRAVAECLRHESDPLSQRIRNHKLLIVGAEYALETGVVDFFEGVP